MGSIKREPLDSDDSTDEACGSLFFDQALGVPTSPFLRGVI